MTSLRDAAMNSKAWPFEEARRVLKRYEKKAPEKGFVLFETGYGPSGLPHIGTFGEVQRTTMIRRAFEIISDIPTKLIVFSDDLDGMRKVPDNVPNPAMLKEHLQRPLTSVPDPFGGYESFGHHNNAMLRRFLDTFGFGVRVHQRDRFLQVGPVRRDPAALLREVRCDHGDHAGLASGRTAADLLLLPADPSRDGPRALRSDERGECKGRHDHLRR